MKFIYHDGGREAAGFTGKKVGDCVCRAICITTGLPYSIVYDRLAEGNKSQRLSKHSKKRASAGVATAAHGIYTKRKWFTDYMKELGFTWTPTMLVGQGCKVHLHDGELPMGRLVVAVSKHYTSVIDGVVYDTWNPQREQWFNVAGPHHPDGDRDPIKELGETKNENGVWRMSRRCVYGYWKWEG